MGKCWLSRMVRWGLRTAGPDDRDEAHRAAAIAQNRLEEIRRRGAEVSEVAGHLREVKERNGFADLLAQSMTNKRGRRP